jgi:hypothetical protein
MTALPEPGTAPRDCVAVAPVGGPERHPKSILLVRVAADRIEVNEHLTDDRTAALVRKLRGLGVAGEIIFRTPCG